MANFVETAESILKRCAKETMSDATIQGEKVEVDFMEHVWAYEFTTTDLSDKKFTVKRDFFIASKVSGIVQFYVHNSLDGRSITDGNSIKLAEFSLLHLSRNAIAKSMESIVKSLEYNS